jgi:hypothetical protein
LDIGEEVFIEIAKNSLVDEHAQIKEWDFRRRFWVMSTHATQFTATKLMVLTHLVSTIYGIIELFSLYICLLVFLCFCSW